MDRKVKAVTDLLRSLDWVVYVLQVGSSLGEENPKDIDILVGMVFLEKENHYAKIQSLLESANGIQNIKVSDDALRFMFQESVFDIALYAHEKVYSIVTGVVTGTVLEGRLAHWATRAWLPEGFCADLRLGKILYDKSGTLKSLIKSLQVYPQIFKEKVMERCSLEIESKFIELHRIDVKSLDSFLIRADIAAAIVRYAFACDSIYLSSYKKLNKKAEELSLLGKELFSLAEQIKTTNFFSVERKINQLIKNKNRKNGSKKQ